MKYWARFPIRNNLVNRRRVDGAGFEAPAQHQRKPQI
jgi:hypothetical protein